MFYVVSVSNNDILILGPIAPKVSPQNFEIVRTKVGVKVWKDKKDTFKRLPQFLTKSYHFQTPTRSVKDSEWGIDVHGPSTIYLVQMDLAGANELTKKSWAKQIGEVIVSCCKLKNVWKKRLIKEGSNTIVLPKIDTKDTTRIIFIKGIQFQHLILI